MLTVATISVSAFGTNSLLAQESIQEGAQSNGMQGNMMGEGHMQGNMMGQMHSMMEKCNAMMETMQQKQSEGDEASV
ncbi:hypothetical protein [Halomonas sp. WWR20]